MVKVAETNTDLAFKVSRVELKIAGSENHSSIETQLAVAAVEVDTVKDDLEKALDQMSKIRELKKAIEDSRKIGNDVIEAKRF